jgi:tetratricopeptide (TPR) repeat protein
MASVGEPLLCRDWFAASDAEMAWRTGRFTEALELAHQAIDEARAAQGIFAEALAQRVLAQTLAAQGNWTEAERHLQTSMELFETGELRLEVAHTHVVWAELLIEQGDIPAARAHLEQAIATYERSGIEEELTRARRLLGALTDASSA